MDKGRVLIDVYRKNAEMPLPKKGTKGLVYVSLGILALSCIMIPCCLMVGYISYIMSTAFLYEGNNVDALLFELHIISAMSMIFTMLVIFSVLFFSADREHMVTLPVTPTQLLLAKFRHTYVAESIMEFMVLFSMFVGYFVAAGKVNGWKVTLHPLGILMALMGTIVTPLLPLAYCTILSLLLMRILRKVRNAKVFYRSSTVLLLLFAGIFLLSFRGIGEMNMDNYIDSLVSQNNFFMQVCNVIFFTVPLLGEVIGEGRISSMLLYISGNAAAVLLMLALGKWLYQEGLYTAGALGSTKKNTSKLNLKLKTGSAISSYLKKELRVLLRTRAYSANCFYINLLWPVGAVLFFYLMRNNPNWLRFLELYRGGAPRAALLLLLTVVGVSFVASGLNTLASTAFTREGAHVDLIKYIPVPYRTQLLVKGLVSLIITGPALILTIIISGIYLGFSIIYGVIYCLLALASLLLAIVIGLGMDSASPYTLWEDEYSALRGNLNSFFSMAICMLLAVLTCGLCFLIYELTPVGVFSLHLLLLAVMILLDVVAIIVGSRIILRNMEEIY